MRKSGRGRDPSRHADGPAPPSEKFNALVGGGVARISPSSANLDSAFGDMQLFAPESTWRAAGLLDTLCAHIWHSLLCGCHSCHSDGLALTGPQSLVLRLV